MDDRRLLGAIAENTRFLRAVARASPGARLVESGGLMALICPAAPTRSVLNCVVYEDADELLGAYDELDSTYVDAGVLAWTVWAAPGERATARLAERGHVLDASPEMMGIELSALEGQRPAGPEDWAREIEPQLLGEINDAAYGFSPPSFGAAFEAFPIGEAHWYVARLGAEPVACLMVLDEGEDVDVNMVATLPRARGRGLVTQLLTHALLDARERGHRSATLVATKLGRPVYERLGFRGLGAIEMWEKRR